MDVSRYEKLRKKNDKKDFEGRNKGLDYWLFRISFFGNIVLIFFSYFLLYPALYKAVSLHIVGGYVAVGIAFIFSVFFLSVFELIKRYVIRNLSSDYITNEKKFKAGIVGWITILLSILALSFYISISGSKKFGSTAVIENKEIENVVSSVTDSLTSVYEAKKRTFITDNDTLRNINNGLRLKLAETPLNYSKARIEYQANIDKNVQIIRENQKEIDRIDEKMSQHLAELKKKADENKINNADESDDVKLLFVIIAIVCEIVIFVGVYFREYYEFNLYKINSQKYEKLLLKKERYRALLAFIYSDGKSGVGDKVISGNELKELVANKTTIQNSNRFVDEFLHDMDRMNVFNTQGKRRYISASYEDAIKTVDNFDNTLQILENMK